MSAPIDEIALNFNAESLKALNIVIGVVMYGVALDFDLGDFKRIIKSPKAPLIGLVCQFLLLPALAFGVSQLLNLSPSVSLGLLLISTCPGGNLSNLFTSVARGNTALSVTMSAVSTLASVVMTPFNLAFWGSMDAATAKALRDIHIDPLQIFFTILLILIIPSVLGILTKLRFPLFAKKFGKACNAGSFLVFALFAGVAFAQNYEYFLDYVGVVFWPVLLTNVAGIFLAWLIATKLNLLLKDVKAISFEVGIQNAAFGLILVFNFFDGLGGMAVVAAWWGIWHVISGGALALHLLSVNKKQQTLLAGEDAATKDAI